MKKNKIVAIIQARMSSTRLPGKVLMESNSQSMLQHMINRITPSKLLDNIVIATTNDPSDQKIINHCVENNYSYTTGSLDDVLERYYECAKLHKADIIVRLTADCPLHDHRIIDHTIEEFLKDDTYDYLSNTTPPPASYPDGMDVEIFTFAALENAWKNAKKPSEREHVTFYFWKNLDLFKCKKIDYRENVRDFRLTLDYQEDFELTDKLFSHFLPDNPLFSMEEMINYLRNNPQIKEINSHIEDYAGWKPSLEKDKELE
ncbi:cytidylyltransferase domain-containing protein [Halobacteriovorax sp. HLS]|uniref:cytidylyltransferase domain-containing protein n=1 Tax=Halobacteriovorax sp. HLS TaxID=2234000 RepID=UPI000FDC3463|nr:glycosyltransferase family protein [Halobacteriovorax sp. HLS]